MVSRLTWRAAAVQARINAATRKALTEAAEELLRKANETVPFETGALAGSGSVDPPQDTLVTIRYTAPYAVKQHDDLTLRHPNPRSPKSSPRGRARWLELTAQEQAARLGQWIATAIRRQT